MPNTNSDANRKIMAAMLPLALCALMAQASEVARPRNFAYVLQAENLAPTRSAAVECLTACGRDWIILDTSFSSEEGGAWSKAEIMQIRAGQTGRKLLAYLSIGEAEDYRAYWKREWDADRNGKPDAKAPAWLREENPDWKGNYRVCYWQEAWQKIALHQVQQAMQQGFDGVYLDLVDAFETFEYDPRTKDWSDHRRNPESGKTYREDMITWVKRIQACARLEHPGALVIPQNGAQLLEDTDFLAAIDAIGVEDLFTDGNKIQKPKSSGYTLGFLRKAIAGEKPVLLIEYATKREAKQHASSAAGQNKLILLLTDRHLKTLGESKATAPQQNRESSVNL